MLKIGLTGGIGSGKSTVSTLLAERGFEVIDADRIAREVVEPGQPALADLAGAFGADILHADGTLNRGELARRAFVDTEHTELLNAITHPRIREETTRRFAAAEEAGESSVIYDMPLLVDQGLQNAMDLTVVVDVDIDTRVSRLVSLRGLTEDDVRRRIAAQVSDEVRRTAANVIIDNNGTPAALAPQVDALVEKIRAAEVAAAS